MSEWEEAPLGRYAKVQGGCAFKSSSFSGFGFPVIKIKNVRPRYIDISNVDFVNYEVALASSSYFLNDGDIVISMTGSGPNAPNSIVGRVARYVGKSNRYLINQRVGRFIIRDEQKLDKRFLFFLLSQEEVQEELVLSSTGSANQANISNAQIENLLFSFPPLSEQKAIASILSSLDDKIELNREMNETLEAMARAIFKDWFVDFGPTRAKQEGRSAYLPEHLWSLFPEAIDDETGLPIGWRLGMFEDLASAKQGRYLSKDKISAISTSDFPCPVWGGNGVLGFSKTYIYKERMILITCRGSNCGLIRKTSSESWVSNNSFAVKPNFGSYFFLYIYFLFEDFSSCISGSAQPQITYAALKAKIMAYPFPKKLVDLYSNLLEPVSLKMEQNDDESWTLAELRDRLLPKLMSGEIRVKDAEKIVEDSV